MKREIFKVLVILMATSGTLGMDLGRFLWHGNAPPKDQVNPQIVEVVRWRQPVCVIPGVNVPPCLLSLRKFQDEYEQLSTDKTETKENPTEDNADCKTVISPKVVNTISLEQLESSELEIIPQDENNGNTKTETMTLDDVAGSRLRRAKQLVIPSFGAAPEAKPPAIYVTKVINSPVTATLVAHNCLPDIGVPLCKDYQTGLKNESNEPKIVNPGVLSPDTNNAIRLQIEPTRTAEIELHTRFHESEKVAENSNDSVETTTEENEAHETGDQRIYFDDFINEDHRPFGASSVNQGHEEIININHPNDVGSSESFEKIIESTTTNSINDIINELASGENSASKDIESSENNGTEDREEEESKEGIVNVLDKFLPSSINLTGSIGADLPILNPSQAQGFFNQFPFKEFNKLGATTQASASEENEEPETTTPDVNFRDQYSIAAVSEEQENTTPDRNAAEGENSTTEPPEVEKVTHFWEDPNNPHYDDGAGSDAFSIIDTIQDIVSMSKDTLLSENPFRSPTEAVINEDEPEVKHVLVVEPTEKSNIFQQLLEFSKPLAEMVPELMVKEAGSIQQLSEQFLNSISLRSLENSDSQQPVETPEKIALNFVGREKRDVGTEMFDVFGKMFTKASKRPLLVQRPKKRPLLVEKPIFISEKPLFPDWLDIFDTPSQVDFSGIDYEVMKDPVYIVEKPSEESSFLGSIFLNPLNFNFLQSLDLFHLNNSGGGNP